MTINSNKKNGFIIPTDDVELVLSGSATATSELSVSGSAGSEISISAADSASASADDVVSGSAGSLIVDPSVDATVSVISAASAEQTYINTSGSINNVSFGFQAGITFDSDAVSELNNYNTSNGTVVELSVVSAAAFELSGSRPTGSELSVSGSAASEPPVVSVADSELSVELSGSATAPERSVSGSAAPELSRPDTAAPELPVFSATAPELSLSGSELSVDDSVSFVFPDPVDDSGSGSTNVVLPVSGSADDFISGSGFVPDPPRLDIYLFSGYEAASLLGDNKINKLISFGKNPREQQKKSENNQGFHQTAFGKNTLSRSSGNSNTAFGTESGISITTGKRNTLIGNSTDISKEDGLAQLVIGYGAKGHANYTAVLGGSNNDEKSYEQTALKEIIPSVDNYTNLGSIDYRYKELFVNKLNNGVVYTLPTQSDISNGDFLDSDDNGQLSLTTLDKFKGLYVQRTDTSKSKQTITSISGVASITVSDIIKSQGRIYLDANTTSIVFTSTAKDFIDKLELTKDYDFTFNLYIYTKASSDLGSIDDGSKVTVSDTSNITLTYFLNKIHSTENNQFSNNSTRLVIRRLTSSTIEIEFTK